MIEIDDKKNSLMDRRRIAQYLELNGLRSQVLRKNLI